MASPVFAVGRQPFRGPLDGDLFFCRAFEYFDGDAAVGSRTGWGTSAFRCQGGRFKLRIHWWFSALRCQGGRIEL